MSTISICMSFSHGWVTFRIFTMRIRHQLGMCVYAFCHHQLKQDPGDIKQKKQCWAPTEGKIFNDPVHGTIKMEPFLVKIIDTPEFQRLRHIKQLGGAYYVYPEAQHNRFEHSIGTAHLAEKLVEHLRHEQPELAITEQDVLCVKVAGLCHDLGHGPFSHLFDGMFLPGQGIKRWAHEKGSCDIFDRVIERIDPREVKLFPEDRQFIKELINGKEMNSFEGRGEKKRFLYEIVSNKKSGVDVDKWDYFARDCYHLGITNGFDHNRLIECTKVLEIDENGHKTRRICYRDKEAYSLYEMFHTRFSLHKRAYQHKGANAVELMICDALSKADPFLMISDGNDIKCRMSSSVDKKNLGAFCNLDDRILHEIEVSQDEDLEPARKILKRLSEGDRYRCIGNKIYPKEVAKEKKAELEQQIQKAIADKLPEKLKDHIRVSIAIFDYGKGDKNPIEHCWFYSKKDPTTAKPISKDDVSGLLPPKFKEHMVQVFCTKELLQKDERATAETAFSEWYRELTH